jgi:hypothetical protein
MNDSSIIQLLMAVFGFFLSVFIVRAIFSIPKMLRHFKAQTLLLTHIAEKLGVDVDTARKVYFEAEGKIYQPVEKK